MDVGCIDAYPASVAGAAAREGMDEAEIIARVLAGEREAFRHLVEAHQGLVFSMLLRYVGHEETAKELTQESFLQAFTHLKSFRREAAFSTWLVQIALNRARTLVSSRRYRERQRQVEFEAERHGESGGDPAQCVSRKHELERLRRAISELTPKLREVVVLCALEGRPYEEAAAMLQIPTGTVRSRLNKARQLLRAAARGDER